MGLGALSLLSFVVELVTIEHGVRADPPSASCSTFTLALAHGRAYSTPVKSPVFVVASVSKVGFAFGFALGTFGFVLALVQAHFSSYAAGFE